MANEKNKIKELVSDDEDPTVELEVVNFRDSDAADGYGVRESEANTFGFSDEDEDPSQESEVVLELKSDLQSRTKTIGRLQYDIEQLRAKWLGLEAEITAREEIVNNLTSDVEELRQTVSRKDKLLKKRDSMIKSLKSEIGQRDETHHELQQQHSDLQSEFDSLLELKSDLEVSTETIGHLQNDIEQSRTERLGLETEITAREELVNNLTSDVNELRDTVTRRDKLIKKRDSKIKSLKGEISQRDEAHHELQQRHSNLQSEFDSLLELKPGLEVSKETIARLQNDIDQLRAKGLGLETEITAREEIANSLTSDVNELRDTVARGDKLVEKRDSTIKMLKAEISQRDETHRELQQQQSDLQSEFDQIIDVLEIERQNPPQQFLEAQERLQARLLKSEEYADSLRVKLQDLIESQESLSKDREYLATLVEQESQHVGETVRDLDSANETVTQLRIDLDQQREAHEEELRTLRFELGEAQDTLAETTESNSKLASDLDDTRGFKEELERMLSVSEERSQQRVEELQEKLKVLKSAADEYEQKLETKSAAINVLLNELMKKSEQIESIGEIEDVIQDLDDRMSERIDDNGAAAGDERDKVTRLLIGNVGDQELRFPLFKNRLTIGRTDENDIQLKLSYISRRHAVILTEGNATRLIDWGSKNGVYVNAERVKEHFLSNGDIVAVGNAKFRYEERPKRDA